MNNLKNDIKSIVNLMNITITSLVVIIIFIIGISNLTENSQSRHIRQFAEKKLRLFSRGYSLDTINCDGVDINHNGFVNCRASDRKQNIILLECPYKEKNSRCNYLFKK
ncbi:hypothetical protein [Candidatus Atelocyanobacterium thalassae]|uniref:Uncharacterized protein n=1 Tax=cyanobacterium endosymbiont of Braarudosphaera bigelowii TaxID=1285375 RepID=A0ABM7U3A8_9CHRO|nr:hypothetical protein [Candidatus Atelocyanobacterium thalassa]BDA39182.1 hypothetical protein CPARK_000002100 [cyanobacterium endosymbiont of Braarudosphaera bigelowii]